MGIMSPEELDRLEGVPIVDLADLPVPFKGVECRVCRARTSYDDIAVDDEDTECCPRCGSTALDSVEED